MECNDNDAKLLQDNPDMRLVKDDSGRWWLAVKRYWGQSLKQWWCRPVNQAQHSEWKTAGQTIAERDIVLSSATNEWIDNTWRNA